MNSEQFAENLSAIADGLDKIAEALESEENATEKVAYDHSDQDFSMGDISERPSSYADPFTSFLMS